MAAAVNSTGQVYPTQPTATRPGGGFQTGGYDPATNTLHLDSAWMGYLRGMAATGGDPSSPAAAGITVFYHENGTIYWANDSISLKGRLTPAETVEVQTGLEGSFSGRPVLQVYAIGDVPK